MRRCNIGEGKPEVMRDPAQLPYKSRQIKNRLRPDKTSWATGLQIEAELDLS
ncbi:MAG TPA: hypothetical protein VJ875_16280 [Pyrinomonadaceae bacterium]|nr:hypothetical protein [Pyrinomonadaceae bacterium]